MLKIYSKYTLSTILFSATLTVMAGSIIAPVLNLMRDGLGIDATSVGLIITTHALFIAFFSPLIGSLIDKVGTRKPFIFGLIIYGLAGGSGLYITSYWLLIFSRAILGIAVAAFFTSISVIILNLYEGSKRDEVMGWRGSANTLGGVIWPLIGGFLGSFSWHLPFSMYLVGIPLGIIALITIPETQNKDFKEVGHEGSIISVFKNNLLLFVIYGILFLAMMLLYIIVVFLPQLLEGFDVSNPLYISLFLSVLALSAGLTSFNYGKIKSVLSYRLIVLVSLALWAIGFLSISQIANIWIIVVSVALFGVGQGIIVPAAMVWIGELVPVSFRGRIISYMGSFMFIGQFSSPVIFGPLSSYLGLKGVFLTAGVICTFLFFCFSFYLRNEHTLNKKIC